VNGQRTVLVTGGTGFIGSNLVHNLVQRGWNVHLIVRPDSKFDLIHGIKQKLTCHVFEGSTTELSEILRRVQPSIVFHLASYFRAQHVPNDIEPMLSSNLLFAVQLLDAMAKEGVRLMVNTGTVWQHYEGKEYSPVCLYAATKQAFEALLQFYVEANDINVITLKLADTYGPNDPRPKLLSQIRKAAGEGAALEMSPGEQHVDFVHVDDVVEAYFSAALRLFHGDVNGHERYSVTSGRPIKLRDFVNEFIQNEKLVVNINWGARAYRKREVFLLSTPHPSVIPK
jgi:nucleoside-diphosphate-sugar epimerase